MVIIEDLKGNQEPLLVNDLHVTGQLNTVEQVDFTTINTADNEAAFNMLQPRSLITIPETDELYRLSENDGQEMGNYYQRTLTGLQVIQDLDDHVVSNTLTGSQSLDACMHLLTDGTKFSFTIHDSFGNHDFGDDKFGGDHALNLFVSTLVDTYVFEFTCHRYHIDIYKQIGKHDAFVFVQNNDIYALADTGDYTQIRTHIVGTGKQDDNGNPVVTAEYTSPNASIYGVIDDDIFEDDNATDQQTLINEMKAQLKDYPLIQYTANINKFEQASPAEKLNNATLGNWGYLRDRNGMDVESRIVETDLYPQSKANEDTLTFGNLILDPNKMVAQLNSNRNHDAQEIAGLKKQQSKNADGLDSSLDVTKVGEVDD